MRNPWGDDTEWKGEWGDSSKMWNERRKREAYDRMRSHTGSIDEIGKADGIFWISYNDFFMNFNNLYLCRFFDKEYTEAFFEDEWSKAKATAGGCTNNDSVGFNPQMKLYVDAAGDAPVDVYMQLNVQGVSSQTKDLSIGFELYDLEGRKVTSRRNPQPIYSHDDGYK